MKKVLVTAAVSTAFLVGGATAALAGHAQIPAETSGVVAKGAQVLIDGSIRARGYSDKGYGKDSPSKNAYDQRVRLGVKARVSDELMGYIQLETADGSQDNITWGQTSDADLSKGGAKNTNSKMELLQAWIDYSPGNWGIKVGHQPLALGNKLFYDHTGSGDDAINLYGTTAGTHWNLITIKLQENTSTDNSDDLDAYVLNLGRTFNDNFKGGLNYTYVKGGSEDDGPAVGSAWSTTNFMNNYPGMELSNLGVNFDWKSGALSVKADGEFQFGTLYDTGQNTSIDANGYAYLLSVDYKLDSAKVGLLFGYGSGDDNSTDKDEDRFIPFLTDTPYQLYIVGYRQAAPWALTTSGKDSGLQGLELYQLNGSTSFTCPLTGKPVSVRGALSYLKTSEDYNNYGTNKDDDVGTELDVVATWKLTSGLAYKVEAAYLWTGDVWKTAATGTGSDPDDMYFLRHGLELKF